jgi:16S rRNA (adenine1518-N6/adenine1519-N6)-dimethyltransferase
MSENMPALSPREMILALMKELGIEPKKSLGQNFLISNHVINKITSSVGDLQPASIIEIGPGLGALTRGLRPLVNEKDLLLLELDREFAKYWQEQGLTVTEIDALHWDWENHQMPRPTALVSNLPYQISSTLVIDRSLDQSVDMMVLMFQKEVAQRMKAKFGTKAYGMLSVVAQTFWNIDLLLEASSGDFLPPPKVASRVLVFKRKNPVPVVEFVQFFKFIKACFLHPRKLMVSNLNEGLSLKKEVSIQALGEMKFHEKIRAQELNPKQFLDLYFKLGYK